MSLYFRYTRGSDKQLIGRDLQQIGNLQLPVVKLPGIGSIQLQPEKDNEEGVQPEKDNEEVVQPEEDNEEAVQLEEDNEELVELSEDDDELNEVFEDDEGLIVESDEQKDE